MDAFDYASFVKDCAWDIYNKINKDSETKIRPVTGYYIADFEFGKDKLIQAVLHPDDAPEDRWKKWSELKYPFRDL